MDDIIITENLTKKFKDVIAVSDLSIKVRKGEIYGFLGLNGAGKTTTIRMLLGMIKPSSGTAYIKNKKITSRSKELWNYVGSLIETPYSYPELTVRENLDIFNKLHFVKDNKAIDRVISQLHLGQYRNRKAKNLSLGNNQRLGLAKALIHQPEILILDEPTNGFDPAGIYETREMLLELATNHGVTIFISSHILGEISRFANRIGILHEGKLIQEVSSKELDALSDKRLVVDSADNKKACLILEEKGFNVELNSINQIEIRDENAISSPKNIATLLVNMNCPPDLLKVEEEDLETYFLRILGIKK